MADWIDVSIKIQTRFCPSILSHSIFTTIPSLFQFFSLPLTQYLAMAISLSLPFSHLPTSHAHTHTHDQAHACAPAASQPATSFIIPSATAKDSGKTASWLCWLSLVGEEEDRGDTIALKWAQIRVAWQHHDCLPEQTAQLLCRPRWKQGLWELLLQLTQSAPLPSAPAPPLWICPWGGHPSSKGGSKNLAFGPNLWEFKPIGCNES